MNNIISNQRGQIVFSLAFAVFSLACAVTMALFVLLDTLSTRDDFDKLQQVHLLRSEGKRALAIAENLQQIQDGIYLPAKYVTIVSSHARSVYKLQTRLIKTEESTEGNLYKYNEYKVLSLVTEKRGDAASFSAGGISSPVSSYSENRIRRATLSGYHYLSDVDLSSNNTNCYFWGPDVVWGKVHSNTDIWIKQAGGGMNNGWPTFYGPVYTAGEIRSFSGTPPNMQVFRAGYWEHVTPIEYSLTADAIRANGFTIGPTVYDPNRIVFVKVNGPVYHSMIGNVVELGMDSTDVWETYPPPGGEYLFNNQYAQFDTVWTQGPQGACLNHSAIVYSKLWLQGNFHGAQTWCSTDTLYLTGNCTLVNTTIGDTPDGTINGSSYNRTDLLGIVSEKSILVKYGYKDPETGERVKPNCGGSSNGIWIYAALCALGDGNGNFHSDGVFSFEYQHPHPSVPATRLPGSNFIWDRIDLHRRKYPQTASSPWPSNIDYPYYNPLWPEGDPYLERGSIHLRGAVAQRRRGFVHRGLSDSEYPNPSGTWNIPMDFCGGTAGQTYNDQVLNISLQPVNAPNVNMSGGVGYNKDYRYDYRFDNYSPPDFPELILRGGKAVYIQNEWYLKKPPSHM